MSTRYGTKGGPLRKILDDIAEGGDARLSLAGEIDMMRATASQAVAVFEASCFGEGHERVPDDVKFRAALLAQNAMKQVADVVEQAAKVLAVSDGFLSIDHVAFVVSQVVRAIEEELYPSHADVADRLIARVRAIRATPRKQILLQATGT